MNMKLLDLQTGKYLELGKDWLYGERGICIFPQTFFEALQKLFIFANNFFTHIKQPHTNLIINQVAEKVGAVIYGGRYVLMFEDSNGDVFCEKTNFGTVYYISKNQYRFFPIKDFNENNDIAATVDRFFMLNKAPQYKISNIFEEFVKKEHGLENKFDELYNLIYGK